MQEDPWKCRQVPHFQPLLVLPKASKVRVIDDEHYFNTEVVLARLRS